MTVPAHSLEPRTAGAGGRPGSASYATQIPYCVLTGSLARANRQRVILRSSGTRHYSHGGAKPDALLILVEPAPGFAPEPA